MARTKQTARRPHRTLSTRAQRRPPPPYYTYPIDADDHAGSYNPLLPPVFPIRVDALCDIAAVSFAASLIQYKLRLIRKHSGDDDKSKLSDLREIPETEFVSVPLPKIVKQRTTALLPTMHKSLDIWVKYHHWTIYWDLNNFDVISVSERLDEIVWRSNGSINYGQTAEKMLHSGKMIAIKKFRLVCVYCFEDSVRNLISKVSNKCLKLDLENHDKFCEEDPLFNYWYNTKPDNNVQTSISRETATSIIKLLVSDGEANFNAIEYAWNKVHGEDRMEMQHIIRDLEDSLCTWRVLIDLNAFEFDVVIKEDGERVLECFAKDPQFDEVTITIWRYMIDRIADDDKLVEYFFGIRGNHKFYDAEHETHLIQQMWHYAPEQLRFAIEEDMR